jgi:beta-N-acetylhexosaminidase
MRLHAPLIIDIAGTSLTDADRARLAHPLVGGIILFKRNWEDRARWCSCAPTSRPCSRTC